MEQEQSALGPLLSISLHLSGQEPRALWSSSLGAAGPKGVCPCYWSLSVSLPCPKQILLGLMVLSFFCLPTLKHPGELRCSNKGNGTAVVRLLKFCGKAAGSLEVRNGGRIKELHEELHV